MEKIRKIADKVFTVRNFLILMCVVSLICVCAIKKVADKREKASERVRLNPSVENMADMDKVENISKALKVMDITDDSVEGVMLGVDVDGAGCKRYYFTDKDIIENVIKKLDNTKLTKMEFINWDEEATSKLWEIQMCPSEGAAALDIFGKKTASTGDECYRTEVWRTYKEAYYSYIDPNNEDIWKIFGSQKQLLFDSDIAEFIADIIEENITEIDMESVIDICTGDEVDLGRLFGFWHTAPEDAGEMLLNYVFEFPIKGTDSYVLIEKETHTENNLPCSAIIRLELYNSSGECLDMLKADEEDVRAFAD